MPRRHAPKKHTPYQGEVSTCGEKKRYRSEAEITDAIELIELQRPQVALSAYKCPYCSGWHLTSKKPSA